MGKLTEMTAYKVSSIDFNNNVTGKVQLKLKNKVSHNVKYSSAGFCEATTSVEVFDENARDTLNVNVVITGMFRLKTQAEKEFVHVETFNELFLFAKTLITTISSNAGIPPIFVKHVDIEKQEIYRFELGNKKEAEE